MSTLDDWTGALCAEFGLETGDGSARTVLDLARIVAHNVDRPAAPLIAYLLGLAVGGGQPLGQAADRIRQLAESWPAGR